MGPDSAIRQAPSADILRRLFRLAVAIAAALLMVVIGASPGVAQAPSYTEADSVRVVYWPGDQGAARLTLDAARAPMSLPGIPAAYRLPPSTIFLAQTPELFDSLSYGGAPGWAAAVAIPSQRRIVIPAYGNSGVIGDPVITLRHEIAHLALAGYVGSGPRWFDEGYATWVSGGWDERSGWQIRLALLGGSLPPLDSLTLAWPRSQGRARLSYLLSASAVRYLATSRGDRALASFFEQWRESGSFDAALREVYLLTPTQLEREWRGMVRSRYGWLLAISQLTAFWGGFALLVIVLGSLRRRRDRERLEELRKEEYMLPPGPPVGVDPGIDRG